MDDLVHIRNLHVNAITGNDAWKRPLPQPLRLSVELRTSFEQAALTDDLKYSLNYAVISRNMLELMKKNEARNFHLLENIGRCIGEVVLDRARGGGADARIEVSSTKTEIRAEEVKVVMNRRKTAGSIEAYGQDKFVVSGLRLLAVIGVFTFERLQRQVVSLDIEMMTDFTSGKLDFQLIVHEVVEYVESSNFKTVEALVLGVNQLVTARGVARARVRVEKPNAITFADGVGVTVEKSAGYFVGKEFLEVDNPTPSGSSASSESFNFPTYGENHAGSLGAGEHTAYIAFGTNEGNQVSNITRAIAELNARGLTVLATSSLYESLPMYHLAQPNFINGVLKLRTHLSPFDLLKELQDIESNTLNRVKLFVNGPRTIDLDILLYDNIILNTPKLIIPHISMIERTFVLQPLCELLPPDEIHPVTAEPFHDHLQQLFASGTDRSKQVSQDLKTVLPMSRDVSDSVPASTLLFNLIDNTHATKLMGILNTTPDSFSDGGTNTNVAAALDNVTRMVNEGADIIDIGGVSTQPGSGAPDVQEELRRVVPIIQAIRSASDARVRAVTLSVDTYRAAVAEAALAAGADIINDISGGLYDDEIFRVVAQSGAPYVLCHTRGTPETMSQMTVYEANSDENLVEYMDADVAAALRMSEADEVFVRAVARELALRAMAALRAGVKKWQLILDPNLGFAKGVTQNLQLIRFLPAMKTYSLTNTSSGEYVSFNASPMLLGPSRKRFIGEITGEPVAQARVIGTAASVMACVAGKTDIVRVHDVKEMKQVCLMGDALYRMQGTS
ncbi:hypothetical protein BABINDRAFT_161342 [Babjeviella inositovora NRRL Y-12698]|uniref:Folic acid synthesis protein fol1 n=1 Tax=Babjeviella inositovora NRRL Y-12698 TaxID=984486 RepID=A0A1E3QRQ8_9ASCO|nr:uncharacterized protein BABINDRAFT_161342 [Babjeviella inositovora NRRL Y-12698]ODQ80396.1 hypothetical protein BABINDRAFT_161342 [Babjeviella inositovora NRRL Y-12698]